MVFVTLPESAEVVGDRAQRRGRPGVPPRRQPAGTVQWKHQAAGTPRARERLLLKIMPRQSRPFDLAVRWESKPVASQAMIEVQEPKLLLQLEGPREVLYGKKETYPAEADQHGQRQRRERGDHADAHGNGRERAGLAQGRHAGRRGRESARRRVDRPASGQSGDPGRSAGRRRSRRIVGEACWCVARD